MRRPRAYIVCEETQTNIYHEVIATSKEAAIERWKSGEGENLGTSGPSLLRIKVSLDNSKEGK